ncbi:hypothetical protein C0Q70_18056 [Pomacea canaliculata]|uniref:Uncharacterized protein n=1 Tax=Pomacea canaliculata TaxID=400727 RepID=A0A2T7NM61_POMCA|nr:integumentary mucin A.1-like [Pomacea canaliculata]PVD22248.1 hypothetical protein C0Q70_18056 [Pomacea canaliculata]
MKLSVALLCLALGVCAHAFTVPADEVTTTAGLPPIETVPTETIPPAVDDSTTTPPAPVVDDSPTTPPAPVVDDSTTTPPAPVVDDNTTTPPATVVDDFTTTSPATVVDDTTTPPATVAEGTTTTTIPPPPYQCYDCNSGTHTEGGWLNPDCPVNGAITPTSATSPCNGPCVSFGSLWPAGTINRGCERNFWFPETYDTSPGCRVLDKVYWCFSLGDLSNTQNLTDVSKYYLEEHYKSTTTTTTTTASP